MSSIRVGAFKLAFKDSCNWPAWCRVLHHAQSLASYFWKSSGYGPPTSYIQYRQTELMGESSDPRLSRPQLYVEDTLICGVKCQYAWSTGCRLSDEREKATTLGSKLASLFTPLLLSLLECFPFLCFPFFRLTGVEDLTAGRHAGPSVLASRVHHGAPRLGRPAAGRFRFVTSVVPNSSCKISELNPVTSTTTRGS